MPMKFALLALFGSQDSHPAGVATHIELGDIRFAAAGDPVFRHLPLLDYKTSEAAMNVQLDLRMDRPEFLTWVQGHAGRYDLAGSRVVMMTGGSRGHAIIVRRLAAALEKRLDGNRWTVLTSDFGVDLGPSPVRFPAVVVDVASGRLTDLTATPRVGM